MRLLPLAPLLLALPAAHAQQLHSLFGTPFDHLGTSVDGAGDVNGDGFADVIVGAPGFESGGLTVGRARVYSGLDGAVLQSQTGVWNDGFARDVAGVGDLDQDGRDDFAVGSWLDDTAGNNAGSATVYSGLDGSVLYRVDGPLAEAVFGYQVVGLGDADGDGVPDFAVGGPNASATFSLAGLFVVYSGADGSQLLRVDGDAPQQALGRVLDAAGDVNGDGFADIIAGLEFDATFGAAAGAARVYSGLDGSVLHTFYGAAPADHFGRAVGGAGDVDGDGRDDVVVGSPGHDLAGDLSGVARIFSGLDGSVLHSLYGFSALDGLGSAVDGVGDVNGDGRDDVAVSADRSDLLVYLGGYVRVHSGLDGALLHLWHGQSDEGFFGRTLAAAGDANGDGVPDVVIGAPEDEQTGIEAGSAFVFSGGFVEPPGYCYADGTGVGCPCGNLDPAAGCANSTGQGARLIATGSASLSADDLVFSVVGCPLSQFGILMMSDASVATPLGGGALCLGGSIQRSPAAAAGLAGAFSLGPGLPAGHDPTGISTSYFQAWYRDPADPCGATSNLTNGVTVSWVP